MNEPNDPAERDELDELDEYVVEDFEALDVLHGLVLGRVTWAFSQLEVILKVLITNLIGDTRAGQIITANMRFGTLQQLVSPLARERLGEESDEFLDLEHVMRGVEAARVSRNNVIHATWLVQGEEDEREHMRTIIRIRKGKVRITNEPFDIDQLQEVVGQITDASDALLRFMVFRFPNYATMDIDS